MKQEMKSAFSVMRQPI